MSGSDLRIDTCSLTSTLRAYILGTRVGVEPKIAGDRTVDEEKSKGGNVQKAVLLRNWLRGREIQGTGILK